MIESRPEFEIKITSFDELINNYCNHKLSSMICKATGLEYEVQNKNLNDMIKIRKPD